MRLTQPAELDVRAIFSAAHEAIEHPPDDAARELWAQIVREAFVPDGWHDQPEPSEQWWWHASSLCQCPREAILKRARLANDGQRVESKNTFAIGHTYHALARFGMHMLGQYVDVRTEIGGRHTTLPLAARADLIYRHGRETYIVDWKTESEFAGKHRREEARNGSSARPEHQIQVTAGAMVLESLDLVGGEDTIEQGWVVYIGKESGEIDQQPVAITEPLRAEVVDRIGRLDAAWQDFTLFEELPPLLPDEEKVDKRSGRHFTKPAWQCRARSDTDPRGLYCQARSTCFQLAGKFGESDA